MGEHFVGRPIQLLQVCYQIGIRQTLSDPVGVRNLQSLPSRYKQVTWFGGAVMSQFMGQFERNHRAHAVTKERVIKIKQRQDRLYQSLDQRTHPEDRFIFYSGAPARQLDGNDLDVMRQPPGPMPVVGGRSGGKMESKTAAGDTALIGRTNHGLPSHTDEPLLPNQRRLGPLVV